MVLYGMLLLLLEITRRQSSAPVPGLVHWMAALPLCMLTILAVILRSDASPALRPFFIETFQLASISAFALIYTGIAAFTNQRVSRPLLLAVLLVAITLTCFNFIKPNLPAQAFIVAMIDAGLHIAALIDIRRSRNRSGVSRLIIITLTAMSLFQIMRALSIILGATYWEFLISVTFQRIYFTGMGMGLIILMVGFIIMVESRIQAQLVYIATRDSMTGAYTRGAFFDFLGRELKRAQRSATPMTLMLIDFDNFKSINDTWGHPVGDRVINDFVRIAMATLRDYDLLGRFGGDEFMILLPGTAQDEARVVADRIRSRCASSTTKDLPSYSITIGMYCTTSGSESMETVVSCADRALYRAKKAGKNRIEAEDNDAPAGLAAMTQSSATC